MRTYRRSVPTFLILALAAAAAGLTAAVDQASARIGMELTVVVATVLGAARAAALEQAPAAPSKPATVAEPPPGAITGISQDRRRPIVDRQTGLCVDWYFRLRLEEEISRAARFGQRFTVVRVQPGAGLSTSLKQMLRHVDYAADLGDAYAIVLPNTDTNGGRIWADRLHVSGGAVHATFAEYPKDGQTVSHLLGEDAWSTFNSEQTAA